jgi:hypothetical protein
MQSKAAQLQFPAGATVTVAIMPALAPTAATVMAAVVVFVAASVTLSPAALARRDPRRIPTIATAISNSW